MKNWNYLLVFFVIAKIGYCQLDSHILSTKSCNIPDLPVFDTITGFNSPKSFTCRNLDLLTYTTLENKTAKLHIRKGVIPQYYESEDKVQCCYGYITRGGTADFPDVGIIVSACRKFDEVVLLEGETVMVKCFDQDSQLVYENVHQVINTSEAVTKKIADLKEKTKAKPISVLFVVIDSVSRLNFVRTMPKTRRYILKQDFIEMKGYNKIDDNTFPNFIAWLTGFNLTDANGICKPYAVGGLDECPMLWYDFRDLGYATAYAEDWADITTFNYWKKGFKRPPTDYYFKPYVEASELLQTRILDTMPFCTGPETTGLRILNLAKDFANTFKDQPSFGVFWMNTFSHNHIDTTQAMDEQLKKFFQDLKTNGILNDSVVVFLSDHGIRFGDIIGSVRGFFEERLPLNYISLPPWFKEKFPVETRNFKDNSKKLTSTYDLYMTLQHILELSGLNYTTKSSRACSKCRSLFKDIPEDRSCQDAGIPEKWCSCMGAFTPYSTETGLNEFKDTIQKAILRIQVSLEKYDNVFKSTSLRRVIGAYGNQDAKYFLIFFETNTGRKYYILLRRTESAEHDIVHIRSF